jgi:hypothetical protein
MHLRSGEGFTSDTDPLLVLLRAECETVEDECEVESLFEQHETFVLAATRKTSINTAKE